MQLKRQNHVMQKDEKGHVKIKTKENEKEKRCDMTHRIELYKMNCSITKPTKWHLRPAKTQISLGIHPVWSVFAVRIFDLPNKRFCCKNEFMVVKKKKKKKKIYIYIYIKQSLIHKFVLVQFVVLQNLCCWISCLNLLWICYGSTSL